MEILDNRPADPLSQQQQKSLFETESLPPGAAPWERADQADRLVAQIVFNRPLETPFSYLVPDPLRDMIAAGQRVKAPFGQGNRRTVGYCVGLSTNQDTSQRLKQIDSILDPEPLLTTTMLELTRWIANRYLCGWGQVLEVVIPAGVKKRAGTRLMTFFQPAHDIATLLANTKLPPKQQAVMDVLTATDDALPVDELAKRADCGTAPINGLRRKGLIQPLQRRMNSKSAEDEPVTREADLKLNRDQQQVVSAILGQLQSSKHRTLLLHGVTGSGKTEVYIQAIREVVSYGRQAIVLVPEISLTPQTIRRFRCRFDSVAVLHSHQSDSERHRHWEQIAQGNVQVVVGARSAVFAPTPHLGLIVIDEEHETSFKQDTTPRYHARDVARQRALMENVPLILGSATPTLESWQRGHDGHDKLVSLPNRVERLPLPPVSIVDIRNDPHCSRGASIGRAMQTGIRAALEDRGQVILFLNLRGFSPTVWCRGCGEGIKCPNCDITLTYHKDRKVLLCHFCDFETDPPTQCPQCNQPGLRYLGTGTQRLQQEVQALFPIAKCLRMDSDSMRKHGSHDQALESFRQGNVDILLGTQMIAKGLDFPNVTLVGVIDADTLLHQPDLRAAERTFQLIAQVAGRTGRSRRGGRVLVQSACPTEPAILLASRHDYIRFAEHELQNRREMLAPPFQHFTRVILRGPHEATVKDQAKWMANLLRETVAATGSAVRILGPAPALIAKQKGNYRYHFQLAAAEIEPIHDLWRQVASKLPRGRGVEFVIDVDALNMR